ncbi:MAG: methyl-accepting chemotaxis protein [Peptococcaceae bacterium]|nr:methyl-accepting chemotaxis protein [Peptococcaceae bacterium]
MLRSLGTKVAFIMLIVLVPLFSAVTFYNQYQEAGNIKKMHMERARILAITGAAAVGKMFEDAVTAGHLTESQVFDTNYVEIPNTNPKRFKTAYDDWTDKNFRAVTEPYLKDGTVVFTAPVDKNGYLPTHNLKYSQGGLSDTANRTKRIFDDPVGIKAARNTEEFLVQEYKRDTGEIMWDVSAPITVNGKHWGAFRVGYSMDKTYREIAGARNRVLVFCLVFTAVLVLLALFISRTVAGPLKYISGAAALMAGGNLADSGKLYTGRDEIGRLAQDFESMRASLKDLISGLKEKSIRLNSSAEQLMASAEQSSSAATEMASTNSEIAATAREVSENMAAVLEQAVKTSGMAGEGKKRLTEMEGKMQRIGETSRAITRDIKDLAEKAGNISQMTSLITQIADQTNLLALNAAIEAARAGEAGRGFAVVAEEVRNLAEQSSRAAKEIMALTGTIGEGTDQVVRAAAQGEEEIREGSGAVLEAGKIFEDIIAAVEKLAENIGQAANGVNQVDSALQDIAANAEEQSATSEEISASAEMLSKMSAELQEEVQKFKTS